MVGGAGCSPRGVTVASAVRYAFFMPICRECQDEVDELVGIKVDGRRRRVCEDCADRLRQEAEVAEESESVVQGMMGFRGRR